MHTLLTLTAAFALLTGYFEYIIEPASAAKPAHQTAAIIRDAQPTPAEVSSVEPQASPAPQSQTSTPPTIKEKQMAPLNLALPQFKQDHQPLVLRRSLLLDVFNRQADQEVSYNAELVYDAEKGESITGGKVNIKIPFG